MHRILFQIGPIELHSYGLCVALGFLLAAILILREAKKTGISSDAVFDCVIAALVGGLIGARFLFVVINWQMFLEEPLRALMFYEGGLAFQGGLVGGILAVFIVTKVKKLSFWRVADLLAPYVVLGQAIGRIGCFLNGCCYGKVITKGLGVTYPGETVVRMPSQLYSALGLLVIFLVLIALRERRRFDGFILSMYFVLYGVFRFFIAFTRADNPMIFSWLKLSQAISIGTIILGVGLYFLLKRFKKSS
jgi:phosphatidylglycerol:prolipoprotein diacylglycerol transferase